MRVLILYWNPLGRPLRTAIDRHLHALDGGSGFEVSYFNAAWGAPAWLSSFGFDAIYLHTTLLCVRWSDVFHEIRWRLRWLKDLEIAKIAAPQDEYDHSEFLDEWLADLGVHAVLSNFGPEQRSVLYPTGAGGASFYKVLTGYIDREDARFAASDPKGRSLDLVYRATHLPYWFGSHGMRKVALGTDFGPIAREAGLRTDISTRPEDAIIGEHWFDFLGSSRAVLGCESGSSVLDRRGEIQAKIASLLEEEPGLTFREVAEQLPTGWDGHRFFAISPRHFEAILTQTCQVLVRGDYEGILEAEKHYVPLERDYSNAASVFEQIRDDHLIGEMTSRALEEIGANPAYSYAAFRETVHRAIEEATGTRGRSLRLPTAALRLVTPFSEWVGEKRFYFATQPSRGWCPRLIRRAVRSLRP